MWEIHMSGSTRGETVAPPRGITSPLLYRLCAVHCDLRLLYTLRTPHSDQRLVLILPARRSRVVAFSNAT